MTSQTISLSELRTRIQQGAPVLLEALPEPSYRQGHLPGARLFPHDQVRAIADRVVPEKAAEIVVYCANTRCQNSHVAAATLASLGYANVRVFAGGKQEWQDAGLPLES